MAGRWFDIEGKHRKIGGDYASKLDFTLIAGETVDPRVVLEHPNLSLYSLDDYSRKAIFVELPPGLDLTAVPFVNGTQCQEALRLLEIPYEDFVQLAVELPEIERLIVIHNTGRSGSTLLSQVFARLESVYSLSEPDAPLLFKFWWQPGSAREDELKSLFDSSIRFLFRPAVSTGASVLAVKPRNEAISIMDLFHACYPRGKSLFSYRSAIGFVGSLCRVFKRNGVPDHIPLRHWIGGAKIKFGLDVRPLLRYLDEGAALIPFTQLHTLWWLSIMERYIASHERGMPVLAVRYEDLNTHREEVLCRVFEYCDLPVSEVQRALEAFSRDSQEGTSMERERPDEEPFSLSDDQVDEVVRVLARHPVINTSDFIAPGTLNL